MKRYFFIIFLTGFFGVMLAFPSVVFEGASTGLLLWFETVLPTLFPFLIITGLLIRTNGVAFISRITGPVLGPLFGVTRPASFAVLGGFLCGYPMGAAIASDLVSEGLITGQEGRYLLSFCNNTSPMFLLSFVVWQSLGGKVPALPSILILYVAPVLASLLFRRFYRRPGLGMDTAPGVPKSPGTRPGLLTVLDNCIMDSCETITKVGGYIIVFSILLALLKLLPLSSFVWRELFLPCLEITSGVRMAASSALPFGVRYVITMAVTSFGGLCAAFQTQCMVQKNGFPLLPYITQKLITALVTSLLAFCYIRFLY